MYRHVLNACLLHCRNVSLSKQGSYRSSDCLAHPESPYGFFDDLEACTEVFWAVCNVIPACKVL